MKCICHSLALAVKHAFDASMPDHLNFILKQIPKHFRHSSVRRDDFITLCQVFDGGVAENSPPFINYAETRWLEKAKVIDRIVSNWHQLLSYMEVSKTVLDQFEMVTINGLMKDHTNYLLLVFLLPVIQQFESLNRDFQASDSEKAYRAFEKLDIQTKSLYNRVFLPNGNRRPTSQIDLGFKFVSECRTYVSTHTDTRTAALTVENVRARCAEMLFCLHNELSKRKGCIFLIFSKEQMKSLSIVLSVRRVY